jgi:hypothetical protein
MPNIAFLIDGNVVCETGNIPRDESWRTVRFSFTSVPGQTMVELSLRNNAPGGIGNDLAIDNISFRACGPEIGLPAFGFYCPGKSLVLNADLQNSPYPNTVYQWQSATNSSLNWTNLSNTNTASIEIPTPTDSTFFRLIVASSIGNLALPYCRAISSVSQLKAEDLSNFAISGTDTIICNGAPGILRAGKYSSYAWSNGAISDTIVAATQGLYAVTITSALGCTASDDLYVYEVKLTAEADWKNPVCAGDSTGSVVAHAIQGGKGTIRFAIDAGKPQIQPYFDQLPAGNYHLIVSDSLQCRYDIPFNLVDPQRFELTLNADKQITEGDSLLITSNFNYTPINFYWEPSEGLNCKHCPSPWAAPFRTTTYVLQVQDGLGCRAIDSIHIDVLPKLKVYAPNVFKPNVTENQDNNYFTIFPSKSAVRIQYLKIFNRWGAEVFNRKDFIPGDQALRWDGLDEAGVLAAEGVYVWIAKIEFFDGEIKTYQGDVTILR